MIELPRDARELFEIALSRRQYFNETPYYENDEPTGNLDSKSGGDILKFMRRAVTDLKQTIVMVTHDAVSASYADRIVFLSDGHVAGEMTAPTPDKVLDFLKHLGE